MSLDRQADTGARRRFLLQRTLGQGTFGSVYLAEMEGSGGFRRRVALKVLNATWDAESDAGRRLRDEARLLGRLQHRHIVRVDDLLRLESGWALLMEYVSGADLELLFGAAQARGAQLPVRAVAEACAAVASALDAAFSAAGDDGAPLRVIHRDIKPSNVRLAEDGEVKVLDFGVARADFAGREARTERVRYGSVGYMAPERLLGGAEEAAGDIYALAVVLYELLILDTYGRSELAPEAQATQVATAAERIRDRVPGELGEALADLTRRMLAYTPADRPDAAEVELELRALSRALPGEDLASFARAGLPKLGLIQATGPDPVQGQVLKETLPGATAPPTAGTGPTPDRYEDRRSSPHDSGTITLPDDAHEPVPAHSGRGPFLAIAAVSALIVVGGFGAIAGGWFGGSPGPDAPAPPAPVVEAAEATPPAAEAPPLEAAVPVAAPSPSEPRVEAGTTPGGSASPPRTSPATRSPSTTDAATPTAATTTAATATAPAADPAPAASASPSASTPRLRAAKFTLAGAEGISVRCGDAEARGSTSALVREFPAGPCVVTAAGHSTTVTVDSPRGVACAVEGESLSCR